MCKPNFLFWTSKELRSPLVRSTCFNYFARVFRVLHRKYHRKVCGGCYPKMSLVTSVQSFHTSPVCVCLCVVPCGLLQPGYLMPGQLNEGAGGHRDDPQDSNVAGVVFPNQPATRPYLHAKFCCFTNHCGLNLPHVTLAHSCTLTIPPPNTQFHVAVSPM